MDDYWQRYLLTITDISIGRIVLMIVLLLVSAFFSMSETVFSSVNVIRLKTFIEDGVKGSKKGLWITEHFDKTLTTILVGNNLANIALATISVTVFSQIFTNSLVMVNVMNTLVMTTIILIFGEIIPKSFAKRNAEYLALHLSALMYWLIRVMTPITWAFLEIKEFILKDKEASGVSVTGDELETIIDTMEEEGSIEEDEAEMLQRVLDLSEKKVYDIMTPRVDMIGVDINDNIETIKTVFFDYQFSRLPVWDKSADKIVGVLHERDFFAKLIENKTIDLHDLCKEPMFVSKSMRVDTLIEVLQRKKAHLAIVSGEFGGTSGIVTMEDALEELVGEIYDEHDEVEEAYIQHIDDKVYGINADIDLEDLFDELELGNPPDSQYSNLSGWLYEMFEDIPTVDMHYTLIQEIPNYEHDDDEPRRLQLKFVIKEIRNRRITYVNLTIKELDQE